MRKPVKRTEDKELNLRLRQRGASGLLRILKSFLSFIRSKIGSHLSLENKFTDGWKKSSLRGSLAARF